MVALTGKSRQELSSWLEMFYVLMWLVVTWVNIYVKVHGAVYVLHCMHFAFYCGGGAAVQSLSHVWLFVTPQTIASQAPLSSLFPSLLKFMSIEPMMLYHHLTLCQTLLPLPSMFPNIRVFSNELALHIRWPKHWSFSFSNNPSNAYSRLDFLQDWLVWSPCIPRDSQESLAFYILI